MNEFKYDEKRVMNHIIELHTFMKYIKFNTYQEDNIGWSKYINPVFFSCTHKKIVHNLISISRLFKRKTKMKKDNMK